MGIHEQELEISQRDKPQFQRCTDCLAAVRRIEFPEEVVEMRFHGRHPEAKLLSEPFRGQALCDPTEDLHLSGRQSDRFCST